MNQYDTLIIKLSNSQLSKLKAGRKNNTEVTLKISSNVVDDSNDENNFPHRLLLTNTQVSKLRKAFVNNSSANVKLPKTQLPKIRQSGGLLGRLLGPLLKTGLPLIGNALKPLAKNILIPLGLTTAASAIDAAIHKKMFGSGNTTFIISNEEMIYYSGLFIKGFSETIKNEAKNQKGEFLRMLLNTLGASLLGNLLTGKSKTRADEGKIATS